MSQLGIFVSHSTQDKPFADALVKALRQADADVWYDEHNLGTGELSDAIQREILARSVFIVLLSKAAFASRWVRDECRWAWNLYRREPHRILLPVVAQPIEASDFNTWLFLEDFKRVVGPDNVPLPPAEAIEQTLRLLVLTPAGAVPERTLPERTDNVEESTMYGAALLARGDYAEAIRFFARAADLAPRNFRAWFGLAHAHNELQHWSAGLAAYEHALALNPTSPDAWAGKGRALLRLRRQREAVTAFQRALALDPAFAFAWMGTGNAQLGLHHYLEAVAAYDRALALNPQLRSAWTNKAICLRALGRQADAQEAEQRAGELGT